MKDISIYTRIARDLEREHVYTAMCKSFPVNHMTNINARDIMARCKASEKIPVDILIPNWNDKAVECRLRELITNHTTGITINRLLYNLRERLAKFLRYSLIFDIPAVRPAVSFDGDKKQYKISLVYSFMTVEQIISQDLYTYVQKRIGSVPALVLVCFWLSLRYSILYPERPLKELAIKTQRPAFQDVGTIIQKYDKLVPPI